MYSKATVIPLKLSPSYLPNNLSILPHFPFSFSNSVDTTFAIIHKNILNVLQTKKETTQIVFNPESFPDVLDLRTIQPNPFILQAKWCCIGSSFYLVLCCHHMVLIYNQQGTDLIFVHPIVYVVSKYKSIYGKGIAVYEGFLCIGSGNNEIIVLQLKETIVAEKTEISFENFATLKGHGGPINCLYTDKFGCLISGHDCGMVCAWKLNGTEEMLIQEPRVINNSGEDPCTGIAMCDRFIIASFGSGKLKFHNDTSNALEFEINAHARWINSIDVCEKNKLLIAVSEDTCVSIWQIPINNGCTVECLFYQAIQSCVLTGCRFLDEDGSSFALTAYDHNEIIIYSQEDKQKDTK